MPYEIVIEKGGQRVITRYFGLLTTADINEAYERRFSDPEMVKKYRLVLSDYTDVTETALDEVDVKALAEAYKKASSYNPNVISIAIMPKDLLFGLGRMWEVYVEGITWKEKVVRTRAEAEDFIDKCNSTG